MDFKDLNDMLFSNSSSQESYASAWDDQLLEEDLLDEAMEDELILWDPEDSPVLTPATSGQDTDSYLPSHVTETDGEEILLTSSDSTCGVRDKNWVVARVGEFLERIVDALVENSGQLSIILKTRSGITRRKTEYTDQNGLMPVPKTMEITFPGGTTQEAWKFTVLVRILELIHKCLIDDVTMTKRDIYYRHPNLFLKQSVVDRYVDDIACTLSISRSQLNVTAAAKGLVAGNFTIWRPDGTEVNGLHEKEGILIPKIQASDTLNLSSVHWILIIEKEATFHSLLSSVPWNFMSSQGVAMTAKGYPDLASRRFLRQLSDHSPHIPIFAFVDFDPDGIAIMLTYMYGSYRLAHENVTHTGLPALNLPDLRWLGVKTHHICHTSATESITERGTLADTQGLMRLTARDRKKATQMLEWDLCKEDNPQPKWRTELQAMLVLNIKAEMQILETRPGGIATWLSKQIEVQQDPALGKDGAALYPFQPSSDDGLLF
ncbi:Spo11/DNA topoisomerase VI subunit A [Massariosphaeria phaeospora]|uniref:DNA topoisomerase (ATP-hydrolyzing) n=1 Tax=Massariosphaeria phaeospora TaxID=100035 RepID=A0A7C8MNN1_9PLEO|nr:Spo11/DNA topoisomerase VI subunit A [Massariosphaeria phaeospora]